MKIEFYFALLLLSQVCGRIVRTRGQSLAKKKDDITARSLQFSNFLDRNNAVSVVPIQQLPQALNDATCPPAVELPDVITEVLLQIPITDPTGCYEFTTPGYDGGNGRYPNAKEQAYECTYEIQLPDNSLMPTFTILKNEFELQKQNSNGVCPNDRFILKNIDELGQSTDDVEMFNNNVQYCGELTEDKVFTVTPGGANNNNRFQIIFRANKSNAKKGVRGLLCFP